MSKIWKTAGLILVAFLVLGVGSAARAGTCSTTHNNAHGDNRSVDVHVLNFFLHHTYECLTYHGSSGTATGHHSYGGGTSGCSSCSRFSSTFMLSNAPHCIAVQGKLHYAITGVCHQGTNRALQATPIPFVKDWGGVKGSGLSYAAFCTYGALFSCYGPPC